MLGNIICLVIGVLVGFAICAVKLADKSPIKKFKCPKCGAWMNVSYTWEDRRYADE